MVKAWINAGKPRFHGQTKGMFEEWAQIMGGILQVAGIPGFLENEDEFLDTVDEEREEWRKLVLAWWDEFGSRTVSAKDLDDLCKTKFVFEYEFEGRNQRGRQTKMGQMLREHVDRVFEGYRICSVNNTRHHGRCYRLVEVPQGSHQAGNTVVKLIGYEDLGTSGNHDN